MVQLDEPITFLAGQYALFEVPGVTGYRAYSMANTGNTLTSTLEFYIRRVPGGVSSPILLGARDMDRQRAQGGALGIVAVAAIVVGLARAIAVELIAAQQRAFS